MKVILFIVVLLNFTYIFAKQERLNASSSDDIVIDDYTIKCEDIPLSAANKENSSVSYDYCRSLYFDKDEYYRCCFVEDDNGKGCKLVQYYDFSDENRIKQYLNNTSNGKIDCGAKYLGFSFLGLFLALF